MFELLKEEHPTNLRYMIHFMHDFHLVSMLDILGVLEEWSDANPAHHKVSFASSLRFEVLAKKVYSEDRP